MPYLKKKDTGAVTDFLESDSVEYQTLIKMKFAAATNIPGTGGFGSGSGGEYQVPAGTPIWEAVAEEDAGFPSPAGGRVIVVALAPVAVGADETTEVMIPEQVKGKITAAAYVPNGEIKGAATNFREIILQQIKMAGTSSPTREVKKLAVVKFESGVNNSGLLVPTALTLESTPEFNPGEDLQVASVHQGTGIADPGGVLYATYTRL
jgi:hypothetical protein